ncbi:hypothetical protein IPG36_01010 [bacterium]|nr:MAG: hypothetical protein IPG36_01010 [bacterium]
MATTRLILLSKLSWIRLRAVVVIASVIVLGYVITRSFAAGPLAAFEPEAGALSAGAVTAVTNGATVVQFPASSSATPTPTPVGSLYGWQITAANTGLASVDLNCASLPVYTGAENVPAGTTITNKRITVGLVLSAGNITIDRSCFKPTSAGIGYPLVTTTNTNICGTNGCQSAQGKVTISNSEFDGSLLGAQEAAFTTAFIGIADLKNNYIHGFGSGIGLMNTGSTYSSVVEGNYVTQLKAYGDPGGAGNHSDGFTIRDFDASSTPGRTALVRNNRFDCSSGNDTGALFLQTYAGRIDNVTISGNLLEGSGYQLGLNLLNSPYSNLVATNNRLSNTGYGAAYVQGGVGWSQWDQNYVNDPTKASNQGAVLPKP